MHSIPSTYFGSLLAFPFPSTSPYSFFFLSFLLAWHFFWLLGGREKSSQEEGRGCGEDRKKPGRVWEAANRGLETGPAAGARGRGTGSSESGGRGGTGGGPARNRKRRLTVWHVSEVPAMSDPATCAWTNMASNLLAGGALGACARQGKLTY